MMLRSRTQGIVSAVVATRSCRTPRNGSNLGIRGACDAHRSCPERSTARPNFTTDAAGSDGKAYRRRPITRLSSTAALGAVPEAAMDEVQP